MIASIRLLSQGNHMQFARILTSAIHGLSAQTVDVEVDLSLGRPAFTIIGLADSSVREARDRVSSAITASRFKVPPHILVNLAPAELRKEGASLDLAITAGILSASKQLAVAEEFRFCYLLGELSLDGRVKPIKGALAYALSAMEAGATQIVLPSQNAPEASLAEGISIYPINRVSDLPNILKGLASPYLPIKRTSLSSSTENKPILSDIWGQTAAKRALTVAAAGGHNLLMQGPPGCGKSMLARRFPRLLPPLEPDELRETVRIHSIAGKPIGSILKGIRPLCSPHQGTTSVGLIGGGSPTPVPGDISLAHNGVLFLDELPEFKRGVLEGLRGPLETGVVELRRARYGVRFPARFQLIAAMNPCPCGKLGLPNQECSCSATMISNYQARISQPLKDRIDLHVSLQGVPPNELKHLTENHDLETDQNVVNSIRQARERQLRRANRLNGYLPQSQLSGFLRLTPPAETMLKQASERLSISARSYVRILRVARTIADLANREETDEQAVAEALRYREA